MNPWMLTASTTTATHKIKISVVKGIYSSYPIIQCDESAMTNTNWTVFHRKRTKLKKCFPCYEEPRILSVFLLNASVRRKLTKDILMEIVLM